MEKITLHSLPFTANTTSALLRKMADYIDANKPEVVNITYKGFDVYGAYASLQVLPEGVSEAELISSDYKTIDKSNDYHFSQIVIEIGGMLSPVESDRVTGCLNYALAKLGGDVAELQDVQYVNGKTQFLYNYDSTSSTRTQPHFVEAFNDALEFITDGTPIRRTNNQGAAGTRLVEGIGSRKIAIYIKS